MVNSFLSCLFSILSLSSLSFSSTPSPLPFPSHSFILLCDYLVVTMLHDLATNSMSTILSILTSQFAKAVEITELAPPIPEDPLAQEAMFEGIVKTVEYIPFHKERTGSKTSMVHGTPSRLQLTPSVCAHMCF